MISDLATKTMEVEFPFSGHKEKVEIFRGDLYPSVGQALTMAREDCLYAPVAFVKVYNRGNNGALQLADVRTNLREEDKDPYNLRIISVLDGKIVKYAIEKYTPKED